MPRHRRQIGPRFGGDVLRKLEMDGSEPLLLRDAEGLPHHGGDRERARDLAGHLRQRSHSGDDVHHLEPSLFAAQHPLLAGDHHHRHGAEQRIGGAGGQVQGARPERREADAGPAGQAPVRRGHEGRGLLVARQHELDRGAPQRLDEVEVLLPGNPEDLSHPLVLERGDHELGAVHRTLRSGTARGAGAKQTFLALAKDRICSPQSTPRMHKAHRLTVAFVQTSCS
jgi:hypothetical protein